MFWDDCEVVKYLFRIVQRGLCYIQSVMKGWLKGCLKIFFKKVKRSFLSLNTDEVLITKS